MYGCVPPDMLAVIDPFESALHNMFIVSMNVAISKSGSVISIGIDLKQFAFDLTITLWIPAHRLLPMESVSPIAMLNESNQLYVYGWLLPVVVTIASPLHNPKHDTIVESVIEDAISEVSVISIAQTDLFKYL